MEDLVLQDIFIYPIKSLGGISLQQAEVQPKGLQYDRRWMLVDKNGTFVSQRKFAQLALLQVNLVDKGLVITHKQNKLEPFTVRFDATTGRSFAVTIWDDVCEALEVDEAANEWFSTAVQMPVRLVYMPATTQRPVDADYAVNNEVVSFADAYPFMMIGQSSLDDLNSRLAQKVLMNRFRPSFVFKGGAAFCEDNMKSLTIGDVSFLGVKLCSRCVLTTINQEDGSKSQEPLRTLASYRTVKNKVMFGQNLLPVTTGIIRVGDKLTIPQKG